MDTKCDSCLRRFTSACVVNPYLCFDQTSSGSPDEAQAKRVVFGCGECCDEGKHEY